jgi:hypothetical protein
MPTVVGNTSAPAVMIAERAAAFMNGVDKPAVRASDSRHRV